MQGMKWWNQVFVKSPSYYCLAVVNGVNQCLCSLFAFLSWQKSSGEVSLKDCLRLFTKEDVLDGEERPVRNMLRFSFSSIVLTRLAFPASQHHLFIPPSLFLNLRHATNAKPGGSVPKGSAFKSSLRSSCFVSFLGVLAVLVCLCLTQGCAPVLLANTQKKNKGCVSSEAA